MDKAKNHQTDQPTQTKEAQLEELDLDGAIKNLRKQAELYQLAGFTHISSLLR